MNRKALAEGIRLDRPRLRAQYREVLDCFADAGVRVHHPPADERLPLQLWARDASFMTPWGMIVGQMAQWWRRGEYGPVLDFCFAQNLPIYAKVTAGAYEGGDFMLIKPGHLLLGYSGERSQVEAAAQIQEWFEAEGWEVCRYPFDPYFRSCGLHPGHAGARPDRRLRGCGSAQRQPAGWKGWALNCSRCPFAMSAAWA